MSTNEQLQDAIEVVAKNLISMIHTCLPAEIVKYDHTKQMADVHPLIKKKFTDGTVIDMPVIVNVPVVWPRGGGALFSFPLIKGDGVLLAFAERNIDDWLTNGGNVAPKDRRKHSFSDAIAIPGLVPFNASLFPSNNEDVCLKYSGGSVCIHNNGQIDMNDGNLTVDKNG